MHQLTFNPGLTLTGFRTLIPALGTNQNSKLTHVVEAKRGIPWVPKVFLALFGQGHERRSNEKKPLAQSALIYCAKWTLTSSLICQSNRA